MSAEVRTLRGPLDDEQLGWVADLYGPVDPKYSSLEFLRHQLNENGYGWSAHAFAFDEGKPVAHTAIVPFRARHADRELVAGKIEAVVVAASHRGSRTTAGKSVALEVLESAYAAGHEHGVEILFGLAPPRVTAIHERAGCRRVTVPAETYVLFATPKVAAREWSATRRKAAVALSIVQKSLLVTAYALARVASLGRGRARLELPGAADAELAVAPAAADEWTVSGADAWDWYATSGLLRALEIGGPFGCRALVRIGEPETAVQIVAWRPRRKSLLAGFLLLGTLLRIARGRRAPTLRFQPWHGTGGDGSLATACRLIACATRRDVELVLHDGDSRLDAELRLTPFFYATF